jgi:thiamine monophosphate synthase
MALVGASCHDAAGLLRRRDADHVVLGPFKPVPGKGPPLGPERFASLVRDAVPRVLALGGLELSDVASVEAAGASGIAVVRTVLGAHDPGRTTLALLDAWQRARHARRAQEIT